jgi:hypothetical protein
MIYHIVTGDLAAAPLNEAILLEPSMAGQVVVVKDVLSVGPLQKEEGGQKFSEMRSEFWQQVVLNGKAHLEVDDFERLSHVVTELAKNEKDVVWVWIAPIPADICTYHWTIKYFGRYKGQFLTVNIAGLPFLDENGKVFFPKSIAEILPKELVKARKLARPVTPGEIEVDGYEWNKLTEENSTIRTSEGGKRLVSRKGDYYDSILLSFCNDQYQKASRIVNQALSKNNIPTGDLFLGWRLRMMVEEGKLQLQGDVAKGLKDFDVKLNEGTL